MNDIAIRVEGLSKLYRLGAQESYRTLRDTLTSAATAPFRHMFGSSNGNGKAPEQIWALKDVSFEVKRGEVVGIIGRNGAGKSTLLKILSRITEPTKGHAEIHGRVGSLLEVGTGFHPELTGRENIYLNGAILGMKKAEIERKFDEIVAFAEVEKFVDTQVKHYSSGMYVRLAFAVAAHMEPEILVIDEVLAVGDLEFQKKCLGKVEDVAQSGRTVLFVSHVMASISTLCASTILLESGRVRFHGATTAAIDRYISAIRHQPSEIDLRTGMHRRRGSGEARVVSARILGPMGDESSHVSFGDDLSFELTVESHSHEEQLLGVVLVKTATGIGVLHILTPAHATWPQMNPGDTVFLKCTVPRCGLYPGNYIVSVWLGRNSFQEVDWLPDILAFDVEQGSSPIGGFDLSWQHGLYFCNSTWTIRSFKGDHCPATTPGQVIDYAK
jgi:lipopolysaccharide transport system ATP-binding protein